MAELLNTLAEASRVTLGRLTLRVAAVDLMDLVRAAVERLPPDLGQRIRLELPRADGTRGDWDAAMLDRVIGNLLSNALKYSPEGSPIDVAIEAEPDWVHLVVRDYGMGLEAEDLAWLFRRFGRGRGARQGELEGLGLGLYLAHGVAEAHGGRLWAESAGPGQGTTMHLRLPRSVPPPPGDHEPPQDVTRG